MSASYSFSTCWQEAAGAAHKQFCFLHDHGNAENVMLLFWLARTTPFLEEAQRMLESIERLEPTHPDLPGLRNFVRRWPQKGASPAGNGRASGLSLGCLIVIVIILAMMIPTALFAPRSPITPVTPTDTPYYYPTQTDIPSYPSESGYTIECRDGTYSHAGGKRGACSYHGGEIP